jgi:hypothetical protein
MPCSVAKFMLDLRFSVRNWAVSFAFGVSPNPGDPCRTAARMRRSETERIAGMDCGNKCPNTAASTELDWGGGLWVQNGNVARADAGL